MNPTKKTRATKTQTTKKVEAYEHRDKERPNNPPVGLVTAETDPEDAPPKSYAFDPHVEPQLQWAGKAERLSFEVATVSLHIHERIDPKTIVASATNAGVTALPQQASLFDEQTAAPLREAIDFYTHSNDWSNRLIAGDSLLVMNSLLQKEGMAGKIQMIYIDPPYGISYGSNFQPFVGTTEVKDRSDGDLTAEPEQLRAFRDTWELGIHSYLQYMYDRLLLAKDLLAATGSIFVQIGDENVHRVSLLLDEVFGHDNRVATITYRTSGGGSSSTVPLATNYLLFYAKDKSQLKYNQIYQTLSRVELISLFSWHAMVELPTGEVRNLTLEERSNPDGTLPSGAKIFCRMPLISPGWSEERSAPFEWNGNAYRCPNNAQWRVSRSGLEHLAVLNRLISAGPQGELGWKIFEDEVPGRRINNVWDVSMSASRKRYVVQTAESTIRRAVLMATDPGDLVLDITCGSGTTAYVCEELGRRWITCDTSRVAIAVAKQRLMTAVFDYYQLAVPAEGIGSGLLYETVPRVSAGRLAYGKTERHLLYDRPLKDASKQRISGPFTVEAVPSVSARSLSDIGVTEAPPATNGIERSGETLRQDEIRQELVVTGIRGKGGKTLGFASLETLPGAQYLSFDGIVAGGEAERVVVAVGPEHSPLEQRQVQRAIEEAQSLVPKPSIVCFCAFQFDPEAAKDIDETQWPGVSLLKVQMNADLLTRDLRRKRSSNESFWLIGQPDVDVRKTREFYEVEVNGFDYYNPRNGSIESGDAKQVAAWLLDTDYDGRSLFPRQVFFPTITKSEPGWKKLQKTLRGELDTSRLDAYHGTKSLPFAAGPNRRVAIKIIDNRGIESLRIMPLE